MIGTCYYSAHLTGNWNGGYNSEPRIEPLVVMYSNVFQVIARKQKEKRKGERKKEKEKTEKDRLDYRD